MTDTKNISGEFEIELAGSVRLMRATFGVIEKLEGGALKKTIFETLHDAMNGRVSYTDVVTVFYVGLSVGNSDTRLTKEQIGEAVFSSGLVSHLPLYIEFLSYLMTGGRSQKKGE